MKQERLSVAEMELKYPDQWLFITDCQISENTELLSGVVAIHSPSKDVVNKSLSGLQRQCGYTLYG